MRYSFAESLARGMEPLACIACSLEVVVLLLECFKELVESVVVGPVDVVG